MADCRTIEWQTLDDFADCGGGSNGLVVKDLQVLLGDYAPALHEAAHRHEGANEDRKEHPRAGRLDEIPGGIVQESAIFSSHQNSSRREVTA